MCILDDYVKATKRSILLKEEINKQSTFPWCGPVDLVELTRPKYYPEQETVNFVVTWQLKYSWSIFYTAGFVTDPALYPN